MYKKRTVVFLIVASMLISCLFTLSLTGQLSFADTGPARSGIFADTGKTASKDGIKKIETALELVKANYVEGVDQQKLVDGAIDGMMNALGDPFSSYMGPETAQQFSEQIEGSFTGIGAEVSMENGNVVVVSPIKGSPAEKAGIKPKDILLSVNGESFEGLSLNEAVSKIRGPKGSEAKIKLKRAGSANTLEYTIVRDDIALETVYARMEKGGVGVIEVTEFSMNTAERFRKELENLEKQGMKGLVIDVRNNPGGVLDIVIDMAEQFVPKGKTIVQVEDKNKRRGKTDSGGSGKAYPVAVITNKGSASASEILAGALQESAGAKLIGEATYGKGTVQTSFNKEFGDGSLLKVTIAKWLTPNGEWIHKKGIQPDVAVSQPGYFSVAPINKEKTFKYDMLGEDIKSAQTMLEGLGYEPGRTDGYFSKATENALKKFQEAQKLEATGVLDAKTAEALEAALVKEIRDPKNDNQMNRAIAEIRKEIESPVSKK
ncbi:S41 family peptidase [Paenibacillus sp. alder61]|uniref:S41 family peptidase n=1 Tax=Paenibacillus sp. alder61 TaxID=2862948 RepID=UPI001CD3E130|nr:S41 family peptidase [Paenibacillus sp. alder61]MCA1293941.1 S41 family peptidase [Paenibacillus sp. alder61]